MTITSTPTTSTTPITVRRRRIVALLASLALLTLTLGCGGGQGPASVRVASEPLRSADPAAGTPTAADPSAVGLESTPQLIARATGEVAVHDDPSDPVPSLTLPATTSFDSPRVLLVVEEGTGDLDGWLKVSLPVRPNGSTGWVRAQHLEFRAVETSVTVDLEARELTVMQHGEVVLRTPTAIGDADHPTPTGTFYITDKLVTGTPDGPYGPYALGLSAHSEVLTEFAGGEGQVGIHGTNEPASIGQAASHGCLRVDNATIERLAGLLPLGTPVTII